MRLTKGSMAEMAHRSIPGVLGAAVAAGVWWSAEGDLGVPSDLPSPVVIGLALASGVAAGTARIRLWPLFVVAAVTWIALVAWPAPIVASYYAGTSLKRRSLAGYVGGAIAVMTVAVGVGAAVGGLRYLSTATPPNAAVLAAWVLGFPLIAGLWVRARRETLAALRDRAERLEREQAARAEQARAEERALIAREMHDVVAHRVSLMVLQAGALEVNTTDERTAEAAGLIRAIGREALTDLRDVLGVLRSPERGDGMVTPQPALDDLDRLLAQSRSVGVRVSRRDEGDPRPLSVTVERTAYRVVQEALTNVRKHAGDTAVEVVLRYLPERIEVSVRNGPSAEPTDPIPGAGFGLVGLRERVELLGGRLTAERQADGGFLVLAQLAVESGTPAESRIPVEKS